MKNDKLYFRKQSKLLVEISLAYSRRPRFTFDDVLAKFFWYAKTSKEKNACKKQIYDVIEFMKSIKWITEEEENGKITYVLIEESKRHLETDDCLAQIK